MVQRYEIIDDIGGGGMGRVRLARDVEGRLVVMKTAIHEDDDERLRDEARVGLRLRHEGIVQTLELLEVADRSGKARPVLVTVYVPGISLLELRGHGPLPPVVVSRLGRELALALAALHGATDDDGRPLSVVHRDVTGANCLVGHDGRARLIDLGIARSVENRAVRTETGLLRGTLRYLAPELFERGRAYSPQTDLWSLGVVLWEALLGRPAIVGSDAVAINRISSGHVMATDDDERPDPVVSRAIGRLLCLDPADRPATAAAAAIFAGVEQSLTDGDDGVATRAAARVVRQALVGDDADGGVDGDPLKKTVRQASRVFGKRKETASMPSSPPPVGPEDPRPIALWPSATPTPTPTPWDVGTAPSIPDATVRLRAYTESLLDLEQGRSGAEKPEKPGKQSAAELQALRTGATKGTPVPGEGDLFTLDGATVMLELPDSLGGPGSAGSAASTTAATKAFKKPPVTQP